MDKINEEKLKLEIAHIFDSGANELRVFEMVKNFIDSRNLVNKNFVLADVRGQLPDFLYEDGGQIKIGYHGDTVVTDEWNKWKEGNLR